MRRNATRRNASHAIRRTQCHASHAMPRIMEPQRASCSPDGGRSFPELVRGVVARGAWCARVLWQLRVRIIWFPWGVPAPPLLHGGSQIKPPTERLKKRNIVGSSGWPGVSGRFCTRIETGFLLAGFGGSRCFLGFEMRSYNLDKRLQEVSIDHLEVMQAGAERV